jgi:hypothetical protein
MPHIAFQSSDVIPPRALAETCLAASPITSTFRITASCSWSEELNASLPGSMKLAALENVVKIKPVVLHKGVASRRMLSRTYQWSDCPSRRGL